MHTTQGCMDRTWLICRELELYAYISIHVKISCHSFLKPESLQTPRQVICLQAEQLKKLPHLHQSAASSLCCA